ncbi:hypothetical protein [Micromonospora sp. NPDC047187]
MELEEKIDTHRLEQELWGRCRARIFGRQQPRPRLLGVMHACGER